MSVRATVRQLRERLDDYLVKAVEQGEPCVVRRNGKDYAVVVSHEEWSLRELGQRLDALGSDYRVPPETQTRADELLATQSQRPLTRDERRELNRLLKQCDRVMLRRAQAMERLK